MARESHVEVRYPKSSPRDGLPIQIVLSGVPVFNMLATICENEFHEQVIKLDVERVGR